MSQSPSEHPPPLSYFRRIIRQAWRDFVSIYYANTIVWRWLKSGALLFFGFFCWSGASVLMSYRQDWTFLWYVLSYGFVLIFWGPLTHLVLVPLIIRLRRTANHPIARLFARKGTKINLTVFFVIVLILGTFPVSPMVLDFSVPDVGGGGQDVDPTLFCSKTDEVIHCHMTNTEGIDHVVITSAGNEIERVDDPPFAFDIQIADLTAVRNQKQFTVEVRDADGDTLRRFVRYVDMIPAG